MVTVNEVTPINVGVRPEEFHDLRASGMLWLINRTVFHPRGLALALVHNNGGNNPPTGWKLLAAPTGEVYCFEGLDEDAYLQAAERTIAEARKAEDAKARGGVRE